MFFCNFFSGTTVSMETTHSLLDLICLYSDRDPVQDGEPQTDDAVSSRLT